MKYLPIFISFITMALAKWVDAVVGLSSNAITIYIFFNFFLYGSIGLYFNYRISRYPDIETFRKNFSISPYKPIRLAHLPPKIKKSILKKHPEIKDFQITKGFSSLLMILHFFFGIYLSLG